MRRIFRVGSASLAVFWLLLWISSYWLPFEICLPRSTPGAYVSIGPLWGRMSIMACRQTPPLQKPAIQLWRASDLPRPMRPMPGFEWHAFSFTNTGRGWAGKTLAFPIWLPSMLFGLLTLFLFLRKRAWPRRRGTLCIRCGYNLTGNTSGVCPECGTRLMKRQIDADARK